MLCFRLGFAKIEQVDDEVNGDTATADLPYGGGGSNAAQLPIGDRHRSPGIIAGRDASAVRERGKALTDTETMQKTRISMTVNGQKRSGEVEPRTLLIHFLRDQLGLTGAHVGCDTSQCGACTISVNGKSTKSCTMFAVQADGAEILTIEGLAEDGSYHPVQEGFWEEHGLQCGYCTPGMIMSSVALLKRNPNPSDEEIRHELEGNICRCTGYENIVKSVRYAAEKMRENASS